MKLSEVNKAADLIADRDQWRREISRIEKASHVKIAIGTKMQVDADLVERKKARGTWDEDRDTISFSDVGEFKISAALRKHLLAEPKETLAKIEADLVALGVEIDETPIREEDGDE